MAMGGGMGWILGGFVGAILSLPHTGGVLAPGAQTVENPHSEREEGGIGRENNPS